MCVAFRRYVGTVFVPLKWVGQKDACHVSLLRGMDGASRH
jgi:hypothetical protein